MKPILEALRKQMWSVVCGVVAIVAVVLSFYPTGGLYATLKGKLDDSIKNNTDITALAGAQRALPILSPDPNAVADPLGVFPTQDLIDRGQAAVAGLTTQSTALLGDAVQLNLHTPLYKDAFQPNSDDLSRETFVKQYKDAELDDTRIRGWPEPDVVQNPGVHIPPLLAGRRPTGDETQKALDDLRADINRQYLITSPTDGKVTPESQAQADSVYNDRAKTKPLEMKYAVSQNCKVYIEPGAIKKPDVYTKFLTLTSAPPSGDVWTAQLYLWVTEDAVTGVAYANADAHNVTDSPVKQIRDLTINTPPYVINGAPTGADDQALNKSFDASPSGRVCNGMFDVVHYSMSLDVDGNRVPEVLESLQKGQFITVLSVQEQTVDSTVPLLDNFFYGKSPIVRLDLVCEDVFLHDWVSKVQPPDGGPGKTGTNANAAATYLFASRLKPVSQ